MIANAEVNRHYTDIWGTIKYKACGLRLLWKTIRIKHVLKTDVRALINSQTLIALIAVLF